MHTFQDFPGGLLMNPCINIYNPVMTDVTHNFSAMHRLATQFPKAIRWQYKSSLYKAPPQPSITHQILPINKNKNA